MIVLEMTVYREHDLMGLDTIWHNLTALSHSELTARCS